MYGGRLQNILIDRREIGHGSTSATSMLQYEIDVPLPTYDLIGEKLPLKVTGRAINRLMI
jgi:hypothetical protein